MPSTLGLTTGPPALNEYAVDPVAVDIHNPSATIEEDNGIPSSDNDKCVR